MKFDSVTLKLQSNLYLKDMGATLLQRRTKHLISVSCLMKRNRKKTLTKFEHLKTRK